MSGPHRSASVPASPNRATLAGDRSSMEAAMADLEELWRTVPVRGSFTGARSSVCPCTAPAPEPEPAASAAGPAAAPACPPALDFGSPLQAASSPSRALPSPDVFADLESPCGGGLMSPAGPPAAAAPSPSPPSGAGSSIASKLSRWMRRSPPAPAPAAAPGAALPSAPAPTPSASSGVGAALDAVDAARCHAMLDLQAEEPVPPPAPFASPLPAGAAPLPPAAACSPAPGSATVDVGGLASAGQPGSTSVNQPRQRRTWGPTPGSEPRRTLSEASGLSEAAAAAAQRPHSALGVAPASADSFDVFGGSAAGTPGTAGSGGSAPRRLSFSFDAATGGPARRPAVQVCGCCSGIWS